MRALVLDKSGDLRLDENYPDPQPGKGEALIRPTFCGICNTDLELAKGYMGFAGVLGHEFVGVVEAADDESLIGKRVTGEINCPCGDCPVCADGNGNHCPNRTVLGILGRDGAFSDLFTLPQANLHVVPDNVSDKAAVFTEPLAAAFRIAEQVSIGPETKVAVLGDGKLGLLISMALSLSNPGLTAVGRHSSKLDILHSKNIKTALESDMIGAGSSFDLVVDATGSPDGLKMAANLVKPCGTIALKTTVSDPPDLDVNRLVIDEIRVIGSRCGPFGKALGALASGQIDPEPLISAVVPFGEGIKAMAEASDKESVKIIMGMGS